MAPSSTARVSPERLRVWRDFLQAHAVVTRSLERELTDDRDLPLTWYDVLVSLNDAGGRLRMQQLAERVVFSRSGITRLVDRMATAGLVRRERCPDDRRGTFAVLTPLGRRRLRDATSVHLRGVRDHFTAYLTEADVRALRSALGRVLDGERAEPDDPTP
jgi:DNA-binding MarR family transcriptional regulator